MVILHFLPSEIGDRLQSPHIIEIKRFCSFGLALALMASFSITLCLLFRYNLTNTNGLCFCKQFFTVKLSFTFVYLPLLGRTNMGFEAWTEVFCFPEWKIARGQWVSSQSSPNLFVWGDLFWFELQKAMVHLQQKYSCTDC